jgi:hypothetical protein
MSLREIIARDLKAIANDLGNQSLTWNSEQYVCIPSTATELQILEAGGNSADEGKNFTICLEQFTDGLLPQCKQKLTFSGKQYRIDAIHKDPTGAFLRLLCIAIARGV